jgi:hypothetical protein
MVGLASITDTLGPKGSDFGDGCSKKDICSSPNEFKTVAMAVEKIGVQHLKGFGRWRRERLEGRIWRAWQVLRACRKVFRMPKQT